MNLQQLIRAYPKHYIAGEGQWCVVVCDKRIWRFTSEVAARADMADSCGNQRCHGPRAHKLYELEPEFVPTGRVKDLGYHEKEDPITSRGEKLSELRERAHKEWEPQHE